MKKKLMILLCFIFSLGLVACGLNEEKSASKEKEEKVEEIDAEEWMKETAKERFDGLCDLIGDELFYSLYMSEAYSEDLDFDLDGIKIKNKKDIVVFKVSEDDIKDFLEDENDVDFDDLSDSGKKKLYQSFTSAIPNYINSRMGSHVLTLTNVLVDSESYFFEQKIDDQLWILTTNKDDIYAYVIYTNSGENIVSATCGLFFSDIEPDDLIDSDIFSGQDFYDVDEIEW